MKYSIGKIKKKSFWEKNFKTILFQNVLKEFKFS